MADGIGSLEAEALKSRIRFLEQLLTATYISAEKKREYQRTLMKCKSDLTVLQGKV